MCAGGGLGGGHHRIRGPLILGDGLSVPLQRMFATIDRNVDQLGACGIFLILFFVTYVGIHIWGIVDTAMKKDWYYTNFPNG